MSDPAIAAREEQARRLDTLAGDADKIAAHARIAATHFRNGEVPRAGAHALALEGHLVNVRRLLDEVAVEHASRARTVI
jgi:hypothetical protein